MRFITTNDLEDWAKSVDCKYNLPHLIRKLILATLDLNAIKSIQFSYGEDVQTGGYDGELETISENLFIPLGGSVWEFGTTNNKKGKADEDYEKRKKNPLDKTPSKVTYVNINCKKYRDKKKWIEEKKKDSFWKDVRYLDAIDIEQWLELAPTVELWLAEKLKKPTLGIYTIEEYWKFWSENEPLKIIPEMLLGDSRVNEIERVKSFIDNNEKVLYIKSITTDEAVAFPLAVFKSLGDLFNADIVIIDNRDSFNLFIQTDKPLIIVAKFKLEGIDINNATQKNHKIIIPISLADEIRSESKIQLPIISRNTFEEGLKKMGIDSEQVAVFTKSSGRNISVLKRLLKFDDSSKPKYFENIDVKDLIPILLINRFSEERSGDIEIVEKLSGKTFSEYLHFLKILATLEDSPVYFINGVWRLVSPTDTWLYFGKYLTQQDFIVFKEVCLHVLTEVHHRYTVPLENRANYFHTPQNRTKYSSKLKEGICETLTVISVFGDSYGINSVPSISSYIDNVVHETLQKGMLVWRSLGTNLMFLAEASPEIFLKNLEATIKDQTIIAFFEVEKRLLHSSNDLPSLLWGLDILAWFPDYLMRVSVSLCEIISISPEKFPTTNTPMANLQNIYRTWYPQTNTNLNDRKRVLEILAKKYPETIYQLLYSLVGSTHDSAFHTPRPKFKLFSELREIRVTREEVCDMKSFCFDNIIEMSKGNVEKIISLINLLGDIGIDKLESALGLIETALDFNEQNRLKIFNVFRKIIGRHRSYPTAYWSLSNEILDKMEKVAFKFKSKSLFANSYLFEEQSPEFIEGREGDDFKKHDEEIAKRRLNFVEDILENIGINEILNLALKTNHPYIYGNVLALSHKLGEEDLKIVYNLVESIEIKHLYLVKEFIRIVEFKTGFQRQIKILENLISSGLSKNGILKFVDSLKGSLDLWEFISNLKDKEVEKLYWKARQGLLFTESKEELFYALDKLNQYGKSITFLNVLGWGIYQHKELLTSEEILTQLEKVSFVDFDDSETFSDSYFSNILDFLYSKDDYDVERCANIEMRFIWVFNDAGSYRPKPKNLYKLMSQNPKEYFEILSLVYLPKNDELRELEKQKIKDNPNFNEIFKSAFSILESFNVIPSIQEDGSLNSIILKKWVEELRELALNSFRIEVTDHCLGKLFAKYPIDISKNIGFAIEIYDLIEEIGTDGIKSGFRVQISNNLGFTSRSAFDGGDIERSRSDYFNHLFEETKFSHPNVSLIFKDLRDKFLADAKWEDENALLRSLEY